MIPEARRLIDCSLSKGLKLQAEKQDLAQETKGTYRVLQSNVYTVEERKYLICHEIGSIPVLRPF